MARLTRADLLQRAAALVSKMPHEDLPIPELGGIVGVRGISGAERQQIIKKSRIKKGPRKGEIDNDRFSTELIASCVVDDTGAPFLEAGDAELLNQLPAGLVDRLTKKINELSGFGEEAEEELGKSSASEAVSTGSVSSSRSVSVG